MSEVPQFLSMVPHPSGGDSIGAPPPPRLKPLLDQLPSTLLTAEKTDTSILSPPSTLPIVSCGSDTSNSSTGGPLSPTNGLPPQPLFSQPCLLANRYLVTRPVDSSSTTHEAIHIHTQTNLLVKCLPSRTAREVCAQHALLGAQEGIRTPLELIQGSEGRSWLVLAPHYGDMHTYVRTRRRIREVEAQRLFGQVTRVVEQCHSAGLVLRDLKLRKFVFTDATRRTVSLESLEDSVLSGGEDTLEDKHGCPAYVAPEILRAAAYSGRAADMWSLGVMLYTMIIGRYPFHGGDTNALFLKIRAGDFVVPEWVSSRARHLIQLLLQRDPASRPTAARVLAHPWLNRAPRDLQLRDAMDHRVPEVVREQPLVRTRRSVFYNF